MRTEEQRKKVKMSRDRYKDKILYGGLRETVILRDNERCVSCGMTRAAHREKYSRDLTVDHKDGKGSPTPVDKRNNTLDNLQTLCLACHARKDGRRFHGRVRGVKYFHDGKTILQWADEMRISRYHIYYRLREYKSLAETIKAIREEIL